MVECLIENAPPSWDVITLGELCVSGGGEVQTGPFGSQLHASDYVSEGVPSVMPANIGDNRIVSQGIARVSQTDAARLARHRLRAGDIVYSRRGDVERRALVRPEQEGWLCGTGSLRVRVGDNAHSPWLSYYLGHSAVRAWIVRHAVGATMPNLNSSILAALPVTVPPLRKQRAIAEVLGALDDKIEANRRVSRLLEGRLTSLFTAGRFDEVGGEPTHLSDLVEVSPSRRRPEGDVAPYIDMAALRTDSALVMEPTSRSPKSGSRFVNGDTLMARITPCLENGKVAYVDCLDGAETGVGSTEFIVLRPRQSLPTQFAYFLARSGRFSAYAVRHTSGSSGRQRCSAEAVARYEIARPDETAITNFAIAAEPAFALMRARANESLVLTRLCDTLLPKLLSGELRVRDAETVVEEAV